MGKPKKATREPEPEVEDQDFNSDNDEAGQDKNDTETQSTKQPSTRAEKKKKKKGKNKDDDWDDIEAELQVMTLDANKGSEEQEESTPVAPKKAKNKKKGVSAFAMLADMADEDDGDGDLSDRKSDDEVETIKEETVSVQKSKKKEKPKKEKAKKQEDEDIDAILADIEKPATKSEKKKKKKNKGDAVEEEMNEEETEVVAEVEKVECKVVSIDDLDDEFFEDEKKKKKKNKKKGKEEQENMQDETAKTTGEEPDASTEANDGEDGEPVMKTAAQKKKEKKEREKQKKMEEKQKQLKKEQAQKEREAKEGSAETEKTKDETKAPKEKDAAKKPNESETSVSHEATPEADEGEGDDGKEKEGKKKKKKKAEKKEEEKPEEKKPKNKKLAALKEALRLAKEEEQRAVKETERLRLEEEERIRRFEEELKRKEELKKLKKQAKKEKEIQLKKEGKWLTEKQKQDKRKLEQMLEAMKLSGVQVGPKEAPKTTAKGGIIYDGRKKNKQQGNKEKSPSTVTSPTATSPDTELKSPVDGEKTARVKVEEKKVDVKEEWDVSSEEEEESEDAVPEKSSNAASVKTEATKEEEEDEEEEEDDDEDEDDDEEEEESSEEETESESESDEEEKTPVERGKDKVQKRAEKAEKMRTLDKLRAPVVCVLGHVDTGKTKILDKLRRTNVQDGEAGGITQQIGATNVPKDAVVEKTKMVKEFAKQELKIPGLLIIDTPGHESFSNLRLRGSSLCDIAILVIDIMHGLEPQTIESINLLKDRKTPFLVALNKIDRLYQWKPQPMNDVQNTLKKQSPHTKAEFDERTQHVIVQLAEEGLNAALFYDNKNPREYVSMVPTSAHSGDGMGNLVALVCELCQSLLAKRLMYSPELQATVMEVKAITGMGTTVDVILINGSLNEGDSIVLAGTEGPIVTQIRGLLMPQPMKELRVKNQYEHHKTVMAAQGVKINAKEMEKALAGLPLFVAHDIDEKEYYKSEVAIVLKDTLESIKVQDRGVFVQASTLGSLEALLEFLRTSKIPYAGINIGPVHKKDIMRASVMLEHDSQYAVILAFDVKVEREAQEMADNLGVRIFTAEIIYHLFDAFTKYREDLKKQKQEEFKHIAVFPCKLRILPQYIFNSRDPIVMGVVVEAGLVKEGTPICVPNKEFVDIGRVASMELNHKQVDIARQGQEICIKIVPTPGDAPKMFGRHFEETDVLVSKISRQSIDAVKDYFREDMTKPDWKLMVELKRQFQIL